MSDLLYDELTGWSWSQDGSEIYDENGAVRSPEEYQAVVAEVHGSAEHEWALQTVQEVNRLEAKLGRSLLADETEAVLDEAVRAAEHDREFNDATAWMALMSKHAENGTEPLDRDDQGSRMDHMAQVITQDREAEGQRQGPEAWNDRAQDMADAMVLSELDEAA